MKFAPILLFVFLSCGFAQESALVKLTMVPPRGPSAKIEYPTGYQLFERVRARRDGVKVKPDVAAPGMVEFSTPGKYVVEILLVDVGKTAVDEEIEFTLAGVVPDPDPIVPPPPPPGPIANEYGIGKIAFDNAPNDPVLAKEMAGWYRQAGNYGFGIPVLKTIDDVILELKAKFAAKVCRDQATCLKWEEWRAKVNQAFNAEQNRRGSFSPQNWYEAFNETALALEAVK